MTKCFIIISKTKSEFKHEDFNVNHETGISPYTVEENAKHGQDIVKKGNIYV